MKDLITVTGKITAGTHRKYGAIIKGQTYQICAADFADQLFEHAADPDESSATQPETSKSKGRK